MYIIFSGFKYDIYIYIYIPAGRTFAQSFIGGLVAL